MLTPMRIVSCDTFADVLREATARTIQLDPSGWPLLANIQAQLAFMAQTTANGRIPNADERGSTSIGPIAARNLEEVDPVYADQLEELDYSFRRYHLLPAGPAMPRRAILQLWSGSDEAFRKLVLTPGIAHTVGSASQPPTTGNAPAHDQVRSDPPLAPLHFEVLWDGMVAHIRPLGLNLITLDGLPVFRGDLTQPGWMGDGPGAHVRAPGELAHRGWMKAGGTTFRFIVEARTPPSAPCSPSAASTGALAALSALREAGTLYAVVDAARSTRALELIEESVDPCASLFEDEADRVYDDEAPYLVQLDRSSGLLERLVHEGWGDSWGIYLTSKADFGALRRHLRKFFFGETEPRRFFRFYDPRVLRNFPQLITSEKRSELMAMVDTLMYESPEQEIVLL